jgi:DNA polymerase-3 subunit gamma/tau
VIGNKTVIESLKTLFAREDKNSIPRAFLFTGPSGCGKTTIGRLLGRMLNISERDFLEYDAATTRGIDTIRTIRENSRYSPISSDYKIYLLDEVHQVTGQAAEALLKLLEDTPMHVFIILCTTEPERLTETIRTRCTTYEVTSLQSFEITVLVKYVCAQEGKPVSSKVLRKIAHSCKGSPRQALVLLDQVIDVDDEDMALLMIDDAITSEAKVIDLCKLIVKEGGMEKWKEMTSLLKGINTEPESVRYNILGYLAAALLNNWTQLTNDSIAELIMVFSDTWIYSKRAGMVNSCYLACKVE